VDSTEIDFSPYVSLALDSNDRPHVCYDEYDKPHYDWDLQYARWNGSSWDMQVVDPMKGGGAEDTASLALDSTDKPYISYKGYGGLKLAQWTGSVWDIQVVDPGGPPGVMGESPSLVLDSNDHPHMSYRAQSMYYLGGALKYATVGNGYGYEVTFSQTGVGSDFSGTVVTIDSVGYKVTDLPKAFIWDADSSHVFLYASPLDAGFGKKYVWTGTSGLSTLQGDTLISTETGIVIANYQTKDELINESTAFLIGIIPTLNLPRGTETSLMMKLRNAMEYIQLQQLDEAIDILNAFINQVRALSGKKIPFAQASMLISEVQNLINLIKM
jgi:hypothetical protein